MYMGRGLLIFSDVIFKWPPGGHIDFSVSGLCRRHGFGSVIQVCFGISVSNFMCMSIMAVGRSLMIFIYFTFKMAAWRPYWILRFLDSNFSWL